MRKYAFLTIIVVAVIGIFLGNHFLQLSRLEELRAPLRSMLFDPGSAQFMNEVNLKESVLCGEVNAKNKMGGYVGFKKFIRTQDFIHIEDSDIRRPANNNQPSTDDIVRELDMQTKLLEIRNKMREEGVSLLQSNDEVARSAKKRIFEENWSANCN